MNIPSIRSRAGIAVAALAILTAGLSGAASAAASGAAPHHSHPVPAPYPGAVPAPNPGADAVLPTSPPAPFTSGGPLLPDACTPYVQGDNAHKSGGDVSAHGWWYRGTCPNQKTTVYIGLQEFYSDGLWRTKDTGSAYVWPGGGSANWATARRTCENTFVAGWRSYIIVYIGNGASAYTPTQNLACQVFS